MFGDIAAFLLSTVFTLFGAVLILRFWMQCIRLQPYTPLARTVYQVSDWLVMPLRRVFKGWGGLDWASLAGVWLTALIYIVLSLIALGISIQGIFPSAIWIALMVSIKWGLNLIMWVTLIMVIMSWVNPNSPIMGILSELTAPMLNPIRRFMPDLGGIDLSPLVLLLLTQVALMVLGRLGLPVFLH